MWASVAALTRAKLRAALSYRLQTVLSLVGLVVSVIPIYFVAGALQPVMAPSIATEGGQYFGFLVVGMFVFSLVYTCVTVLPAEMGSAIGNGTLEALLATPTRVGAIVIGLSGSSLVWSGVRSLLLLIAASVLGATIQWSRVLPTIAILALIIVCHLAIGLLATAMMIAFRTTAAVPRLATAASMFLGGVYYPTNVIPSWLNDLSGFVPLSYGLRALRRVLLEGAAFGSVAPDTLVLALFAAVLTLAGVAAVHVALAYGRRAGTLAHY